MDTFFQTLRDIQKKERSTGTLSEIENTFYEDASNYLHKLLKAVNNNPLSLEAYQLHDAQRITIEICERREFKIISTALANVQKAHDIFKGHRQNSELYDIIPYNTTPEEEKLYKDIIDVIISHRGDIMHDFTKKENSSDNSAIEKPSDKLKEDLEKTSGSTNTVNSVTSSLDEVNFEDSKDKIKKSSKKLDVSQIQEMYGQAPGSDDFMENIKKQEQSSSSTNNAETNQANDLTAESTQTSDLNNSIKQMEDISSDLNNSSEDKNVDNNSTVNDITLNEEYGVEELVVFNKEINTDIIDLDEKSYGPFESKDIAILPGSLAKILRYHDVISILR